MMNEMEIKYVDSMRSRLAEVEKENETLKRRLQDERNAAIGWEHRADSLQGELTKAKGEQAWGCGHANHGSCSQCLGHVTNERNDLLRELEKAKIFICSVRPYEYCHVDIDTAIKAYDAALGKKEEGKNPWHPCTENGKMWCSACGTWGDHRSGTCPTITKG